MSRVSMFSSPLLLGFEDFERTLDRISKMQPEGYPPYNIEQITTAAAIQAKSADRAATSAILIRLIWTAPK